MNKEKKTRRITAMDFFIIFAVAAVVLSAGLRAYDNAKNKKSIAVTAYEEYTVSFECNGIREATAKLLEKNDVFYVNGGKDLFGVLADNPTITPARIRVELYNGEIKTDVYAEKNGDNTKVDVTGELTVKCSKDAGGLIFTESGMYIAPNLSVQAFAGDMSLQFKITAVKKVS